MAYINNAVYWIGADGNAYVKGPDGVQKYTGVSNAQAGGFDGLLDGQYGKSVGATQIADPNAPAPQAPGAGTGGAAKVFNQAGADNTQRTIDQMGPLLQAALEAEGTRYGNVVNGFNTQEAGQRDTYGKSTTTNQQNYDANFMDSIRAGIKGLGGLFNILRGTGAGGGTAEDLARDTVGGVTSQDIRTGHDTQQENQTSLDATLSSFLSDLKQKRQLAEDTRVNNERAVKRDSNTQLQDLYGKMAGFYGDVGNTAGANDWMNRAGNLTPEIAADSMARVSNYDTTPVAVHAPEITAFAGPTQPNVVAPPSDGQVGSGIFTMSDPRRRKEVAPIPVPVGV